MSITATSMNGTSMTLGTQLAIMQGIATTSSAPKLMAAWMNVRDAFDANKIDIDGSATETRKKIVEISRPVLSQSVIAFSESATEESFRAQEIDIDQVPNYYREHIITHDAAQTLLTSAALIWINKSDISTIGGRIEAAYQFLFMNARGYSVHDIVRNRYTDALAHYGINSEVTQLSQIGPPIENELARTALNTPSWSALEREHGITKELLFRACREGIVSMDMLHGILNALITERSHQSAMRLARRDLLYAASGTGAISAILFVSGFVQAGRDIGAASQLHVPAVLLAVLTLLLGIFRTGFSHTDKQKVIALERLEKPFNRNKKNR